ncbi:DEAD/DEAH box helicase [Clostridium manihotivorum]|uniref:DNA helicase n=1 Tax=Clostridium manihotivorum TaxID=2320868 RepID=A0A410DVC4_9CLOT|nr:DEAD/DEAH box helicase [Clostridium manihotivorum]QAA33056.1 DNA helicase [Clostridium manihotivorum]
MDINNLKQIIFKPSSNLMRTKGNEIFKENLVTKVRGKKIDDIYHIYGDIKDSKLASELNTHIKLNLKTGKVIGTSCSCEIFKDFSRNKPLFMCEHITAACYKFIDSVSKKQQSKVSNDITNSNVQEKLELSLQITLLSKSFKDYSTYEAEFRIGTAHKYLITNIKQFITSFYDSTKIYVDATLSYDLSEYKIKEDYKELIEYLYKKINSKENPASSRALKLNSSELIGFMETLVNHKITFKYKGIDYYPTILKDRLPLKFTFKDNYEDFLITTHKKLPISLDDENLVYFFNGQIFLPSRKQISNYSFFYEKFKKSDILVFPKGLDNYNMLISKLTAISRDVTLSEGVKNYSSDYLKFEFYIYKDGFDIYCDIYGIYFNKKINILTTAMDGEDKLRDKLAENKILMKLESHKFINRKERLQFVGSDNDLFELLAKKNAGLYTLGKVTFGAGFENIKIYNSKNIVMNLEDNDPKVKIIYRIEEMDPQELHSAYEAYKSGESFYRDSNNNYLDFTDEGVLRFFKLLELLTDNTNEFGSLEVDKDKLFYTKELLEKNSYSIHNNSAIFKNLEKKLDNYEASELTVPLELKATLRDYQINGFKWLKTLTELGLGGILADEMGLGKTVQTIALIASEKNKKFIIVTPTSLIYNWRDELTNFCPDITFDIIHGERNKGKSLEELMDKNTVLLTTYGTLKNNIQSYEGYCFDFCIIDEAQNIKNPTSKTKLAINKIKATTRFALTGTPIENNLTELWSIFDFVMPNFLYSKDVFERKFAIKDKDNIELLKSLINPFILRRTKSEVIEELPDKNEKKLIVEMTPMQKSIYSSFIKDVRESLKNSSGGKIEIFSYLTKLRQICLDPSLLIPDYTGGSGKLEAAMSLIQEHLQEEGKVLLFSQFTSALSKIKEQLDALNINYYYIDGSISAKERLRLVNDFNKNEEVKVFLISLKAGGTGLNLTSANLVIHFDPWWNPAVENQATDRAHRIGQKNIVEVIRLVAKGTIEEKILTLQDNKKQLIDDVLTGDLQDSNALQKLSKDDLIRLFDRSM